MRRNTFDQGQPERIVGRNVGCNAVPTNIMIENQYVVPFDWRRGWDSNPRYGCPHAGFQDRSIQPL